MSVIKGLTSEYFSEGISEFLTKLSGLKVKIIVLTNISYRLWRLRVWYYVVV